MTPPGALSERALQRARIGNANCFVAKPFERQASSTPYGSSQ